MNSLRLQAAIAAVVLATQICGEHTEINPRRSPQYRNSFELPLQIPIVKEPSVSYTNPATGVPIDFYELEAKEFDQKLFPDLGTARLFGYDGTFPGPTFRVAKGRESVIRVMNRGARMVNLHVHGSYTRAPWDGWGTDTIAPNYFKDYYYPNSISGRTLWYHDHAHRASATNVYRGLVGMYQIIDDKVDAALGIPNDPKYDVPLIFTSHFFTAEGDMTNESSERNSIYGDTILVNGGIEPFLSVEPRKYRFRLLNAAVSRSFNFTLGNEGELVTLYVIGSDGGFRQNPVGTKSLVTSMAERWEIIIDFAAYANKNLTFRTSNMWTDTRYQDSYQMLQFRVGNQVTDQSNNGALPKRFSVDTRFPTPNENDKAVTTRNFTMVSHMDMMWGINSYHMDDPMKRILMRPPLGTIEKYIFKSSGMPMGGGMMGGSRTGDSASKGSGSDSSHHGGEAKGDGAPGSAGSRSSHHGGGSMMGGGDTGSSGVGARASQHGGAMSESGNPVRGGGMMHGSGSHDSPRHQRRQMNMGASTWVHSMHLHLVDIKLLTRTSSASDARARLEPYEIGSIKDTVALGPSETITTLVKYAPYPGVYMWHCHNSIHSDGGMLGALNVTRLPDLDLHYSGLDTRLEDPTDSRFQAQPLAGTDLMDVQTRVLPGFAKLKAYPDPREVETALEKYWTSRAAPSGETTGEKVAGGVDPAAMEVHKSHHGKSGSGRRSLGRRARMFVPCLAMIAAAGGKCDF